MKWRDAEWFGAQALYAALGLGGLYGAIHVIANNARFMDIMNNRARFKLMRRKLPY